MSNLYYQILKLAGFSALRDIKKKNSRIKNDFNLINANPHKTIVTNIRNFKIRK